MHACKVNPSSCYVYSSPQPYGVTKSKGRPFCLVIACKIQKQKNKSKSKQVNKEKQKSSTTPKEKKQTRKQM